MGPWPTQRDENQARRRPRESGGPCLVSNPMDSRFRGNDDIFERAEGDEESRTALKTLRARFLPLAALGVGMTCWRWFSHRLLRRGLLSDAAPRLAKSSRLRLTPMGHQPRSGGLPDWSFSAVRGATKTTPRRRRGKSTERSRNVYENKGGLGSADLFSRSAALPTALGKAADLERHVCATPGTFLAVAWLVDRRASQVVHQSRPCDWKERSRNVYENKAR